MEREARTLWTHVEVHVAGQRPARRRHLDLTAGGAGGDSGLDLGFRDHGEASRRAVEGDAGRAGQIRSQNLDRGSHLAGGGLCFHEWAETRIKTVDRAIAG